MARLLFDATSLDDKPSGTKSRLVRLVPALAERGHSVAVVHGPKLDLAARRIMTGATLFQARPLPAPGVARRIVFQHHTYGELARAFAPEAVSAETWPMPRVKCLIPVIHDLRYLSLRPPFRTMFARMLSDCRRHAVRVHTESAAVASQLIEHSLIEADKIDVVPIGVALPDLARLSRAETSLQFPYVLVVGHAEPRKNLGLVEELAVALKPRGIYVVRTGRSASASARGYRTGGSTMSWKESGVRSKPTVESSVHLGVVTDQERDILYNQALAVLAPSLLEGFGLVPLEALAAGAWTIASDIPAHREVLGDAASFFSIADRYDALEKIMAAVGAGPPERSERMEQGRDQAARFSIPRSADAFEESLNIAGLGQSGGSGVRRPT